MSEEDLELLVTLDDPEGAPEEDRFHHLPAQNSVSTNAAKDTTPTQNRVYWTGGHS